VFVTITDAFAIGAPLLSRIVPTKLPFSYCALAFTLPRQTASTINTQTHILEKFRMSRP
jgi:hypothetical protein